MKFVFWQNVVSIHQSAFIKALAKCHDVTLVAAEDITDQRKSDGWSIPDMGNAKVVISPSQVIMNNLLEKDNIKHIFSGINAYPMVYIAFKKAMHKGCDVSVMMEPYQSQGIKGFIRCCKYGFHALRYGNKINHIFATGDLGVKAFRKVGFPSQKIHQWGYFTEQCVSYDFHQNEKPKMVFIGSIDKRKNILALVSVANRCKELYDEFLIVGGGPLEIDLKEAISFNTKIHYLGRINNEDVAPIIASCDLLVLPSLFDGWGAVVNEALSQGTRVLCSDNCGASVLLDENIRGGVFKVYDNNSLMYKLKYWLSKCPLKIDEKKRIAEWSSRNISGETAAYYFTEIMRGHQINAPWIN